MRIIKRIDVYKDAVSSWGEGNVFLPFGCVGEDFLLNTKKATASASAWKIANAVLIIAVP